MFPMSRHSSAVRVITAGVVVAASLVMLVPPAEAKKHKHRGRGHRVVHAQPAVIYTRPAVVHVRQPVCVVEHYAPAHVVPVATYSLRPAYGATIAAFIGGVSFGAVIGNVAPAGHAYFDPYCGTRFTTLNAYASHCGYHDHPHNVQVVAAGYGGGSYYADGCGHHH